MNGHAHSQGEVFCSAKTRKIIFQETDSVEILKVIVGMGHLQRNDRLTGDVEDDGYIGISLTRRPRPRLGKRGHV